jgi:hypothetical protein
MLLKGDLAMREPLRGNMNASSNKGAKEDIIASISLCMALRESPRRLYSAVTRQRIGWHVLSQTVSDQESSAGL